MPESYVTAKVHEALQATGGDKQDAQKLLLTWAVRDQALLIGLAKPHLKSLVIARLEEVMRAHGKDREGPTRQELDALILSHTKGEKRSAIKVPPPKSSHRQASVMRQIADAFKKK